MRIYVDTKKRHSSAPFGIIRTRTRVWMCRTPAFKKWTTFTVPLLFISICYMSEQPTRFFAVLVLYNLPRFPISWCAWCHEVALAETPHFSIWSWYVINAQQLINDKRDEEIQGQKTKSYIRELLLQEKKKNYINRVYRLCGRDHNK